VRTNTRTFLALAAAFAFTVNLVQGQENKGNAAEENAIAQAAGAIIVTKINDSTYKLYVSDYVYMYAFTGPDGTLLIDTGYKVNEAKLKKTLAELKCADVKYVINTHSNGDHTGGNHFFPAAAIIAHEKCRANLMKDKNFPSAGLPNLTFDEAITLHLNSEEIRVIAMPGGHTNGDVIIYFVKANIVFLGDMIVADTFPVIWLEGFEDTGVQKLVDNLRKTIRTFPDDVKIISSHGRDYSKDDLIGYFLMVTQTIALVRAEILKGKNLEEIQKQDVLRKYRSYDSERFPFINADFWIKTIYQDFAKNPDISPLAN
jgi:cyclase